MEFYGNLDSTTISGEYEIFLTKLTYLVFLATPDAYLDA